MTSPGQTITAEQMAAQMGVSPTELQALIDNAGLRTPPVVPPCGCPPLHQGAALEKLLCRNGHSIPPAA